MTGTVLIAAFLAAVLLSAVFSGGETGLYSLSRVRVRVRADQGDRRASRLENVLRDRQEALSLTLVGTNLANYLATACFAYLLATQLRLSDRQSEIYTTLGVTLIIFVFGEVVPKNLFQAHPDRMMLAVASVLRWARLVFFPAVWVLTCLTRLVTAWMGPNAHTEARLNPRRRMAYLLREGLPSSSHDEAHRDMVDRALLLAETPVHAVMTPRNRVITIAGSSGRERLLSLARTHRHSLVPAFGRHPRRIEGLVEVHRLLDDAAWRTVDERLTPALRLDPHESVATALLRLQRERARMAVVVDRGGYLLGIVTLKDLLEELVGELPAW